MIEKTQRNETGETPDEMSPGMAQSAPGHVQTSAEAPSPGEPGAAPDEIDETTPSSIPPEELERLREDIVSALKTVFDPEIPCDIYELGLIYKIDVDDDRNVDLVMTLTAPGCPVAGDMPGWVENAVASVAGVGQVKVDLTFDPPWDMSRMSDEARLALNMF
ncbi:MAG TPA: SUF system Fe-S cluster assembly protein [Methyloceanibacter sp.]|nr:SUF system Fe-S cluster assembly protein [Methyloceanibacter sp.]